MPSLDICRKRVVVHKAHTENNALAGCKRPSHDYVSASYGVFTAILAADNADSSLRIESLYDSQHVDPAALAIVGFLRLYPFAFLAGQFLMQRDLSREGKSLQMRYYTEMTKTLPCRKSRLV